MPDMTTETRWFRSPYVGVVSLSVRKQMSYSASLSMQKVCASRYHDTCHIEEATHLVRVLDQLVNRERGVVGLYDGVRDLCT